MKLYVGMDVSLKETSICVVDGCGEIVLGFESACHGKRDSHIDPPT